MEENQGLVIEHLINYIETIFLGVNITVESMEYMCVFVA